MWENLFKHIDIPGNQVNILDGNAPNLVEECQRYEDKIVALGGIELFLAGKLIICLARSSRRCFTVSFHVASIRAGIGPDGHIAFNEPGSSLVSRTRVKTLAYVQAEMDPGLLVSVCLSPHKIFSHLQV